MDQVQVHKNKMLRGQVLRTLALFYPSPVSIANIKTSLMQRGMFSGSDVSKVLEYLSDEKKGYIKISEGKLKNFEDDDMVKLTSVGVDLIEGTLCDPGVEV